MKEQLLMGGHYLQMPHSKFADTRSKPDPLRWLVLISYYHLRIFNLDLFFPPRIKQIFFPLVS